METRRVCLLFLKTLLVVNHLSSPSPPPLSQGYIFMNSWAACVNICYWLHALFAPSKLVVQMCCYSRETPSLLSYTHPCPLRGEAVCLHSKPPISYSNMLWLWSQRETHRENCFERVYQFMGPHSFHVRADRTIYVNWRKQIRSLLTVGPIKRLKCLDQSN